MSAERHRLSNVDRDTKTAVCSVCGPVQIRLRSGNRGDECMTIRKRGKRESKRRRKYGLTASEYAEMFEASGGRCAICGMESRLVIDHNHQTGVVRGLLCHGCNVAIGFMSDDPKVAEKAAQYLRRHA